MSTKSKLDSMLEDSVEDILEEDANKPVYVGVSFSREDTEKLCAKLGIKYTRKGAYLFGLILARAFPKK